MGWAGAIVGALLGSRGGFWTSLLGSVLGNHIENVIRGKTRTASSDDASAHAEASRHFCRAAGALFAKMAKADGHVSRDEIASVELAFRRLGLSSADRSEAVAAFRAAKDDRRSIYEYAQVCRSIVVSLEVRELLYEILWDIACADGTVSHEELAILRLLPKYLGIADAWYFLLARERLGRASYGGAGTEPPPPPRDSLADAYQLLGVAPTASDDEVKRAYREKAKKYHPDVLKAQGLPDEMIGRATEQMARINAAWAEIKSARGL